MNIDDYVSGPALLRQTVAGMTQEQLIARPIPGKWSTLEVICHLADFEIIGADRIKRVIAENEPTLFGGDEKVFATAVGLSPAECRRGTSPDCIDPSTGRSDSANVEARGFPTPGHSFGGWAD